MSQFLFLDTERIRLSLFPQHSGHGLAAFLHRLDEARLVRFIGESSFVSMGTDYTNGANQSRTSGLNLSFICSS